LPLTLHYLQQRQLAVAVGTNFLPLSNKSKPLCHFNEFEAALSVQGTVTIG
jgi:hypothetical protein